VTRTTRRNASRSCSMAPNPRHRVGAWFSGVDSPRIGASRSTAQEAAVRYRTRNGGAPENDKRCERSGSTERGSTSRGQYGAGGRHRRPRAGPQGRAIGHAPPAVSGESRCPARCIGTRSAEAEAPHRASPPIGSPARTAGTAQSLSSNYGFASPCDSARDEGARSKCYRLSCKRSQHGGPFRRQYRSDEHCTPTTSTG
jgi:hypothetical protein